MRYICTLEYRRDETKTECYSGESHEFYKGVSCCNGDFFALIVCGAVAFDCKARLRKVACVVVRVFTIEILFARKC